MLSRNFIGVNKKAAHTCIINATTSTVIKSVAVSKSWKFKSISFPMHHPTTTQKGIYKFKENRN